MPLPSQFLAVDEFGRFLENESRISSLDRIQALLENLKYSENGALISSDNENEFIIEAFEAPWIIVEIKLEEKHLVGFNTYGFSTALNLESCYFDEWDRLHGRTEKKIPWVLTRNAQESFFDLLEEFDDESFVFQGQRFTPQSAFQLETPLENSQWWSDLYEAPEAPGWDMKSPHPALIDMLPRMKQPKSRILILGCGEGHDAAHWAQEGHVVTAVDFSPVAIKRAQDHYGHLNIRFLQCDAFELPREFDKSFDFIFEHTMFCAIDPSRRSQLVQTWNRCLLQGGYFMGVFFATEKRSGPPFGSTEWEIRHRLQKDYHFLFWGRWKNSPAHRQGRELFVLAQKK